MSHVGITSNISLIFESPPYKFTITQTGLTFFSGLIGAFIGELFAGPVIDYLAKRQMKSGKEWHPEMHFRAIWLALCMMPTGLIVFGVTIKFSKSWVAPLVGNGTCKSSGELSSPGEGLAAVKADTLPNSHLWCGDHDNCYSNLYHRVLSGSSHGGVSRAECHAKHIFILYPILSQYLDWQERSCYPFCCFRCHWRSILLPLGATRDSQGTNYSGEVWQARLGQVSLVARNLA